jgi:hypothetical protein
MSSTYRILCLSHDPAIELAPEWSGPTGQSGWAAAIAAAADPASDERLAEHVACDLLVGRYSYPLIEVACPPTNHRDVRHFHGPGGGTHSVEYWVDADWLRLLTLARESADENMAALLRRHRFVFCWTPTRLNRLRDHLALP